MSMTVLLLMPLAEQRGGAELALKQLLQYGRRDDVKWHVVFFEDGPMVRQARELGVGAEVIPAGRLRQPGQMIQCIRKIVTLSRRVDASAIFSWMGKAQIYGGLAAKLAGIPNGWFQHGIPSARDTMDVAATLLPAKRILACSKAASEAQQRLWPRRDARVCYPPVDITEYDRAAFPSVRETRSRLRLPADGPLVGIVGRLQRWKGFHTVIKAMPRILATHPTARCVLIGGEHALEPKYPNHLHGLIGSLKLADCVSMVGFQSNIAEWMHAMDVIVHASDREPFGMVVIEAMALGKPVVAGDNGGPREIITPGVDGLLAPYDDEERLADAVLTYLDDPDFARRVGAAALHRAQAFSSQRFACEVTANIRAFAGCSRADEATSVASTVVAGQLSV